MVCYIAIESSPLYNINYFGENKGTSPTSFSHIHALQLAQQGTVTERKLGNLHIDGQYKVIVYDIIIYPIISKSY